jgi:hypothetical protein
VEWNDDDDGGEGDDGSLDRSIIARPIDQSSLNRWMISNMHDDDGTTIAAHQAMMIGAPICRQKVVFLDDGNTTDGRSINSERYTNRI